MGLPMTGAGGTHSARSQCLWVSELREDDQKVAVGSLAMV